MGPPRRKARHGHFFKLTFPAKDGKASITAQIDTHVGDCRPYVPRYLAEIFRVDEGRLPEVLAYWSQAQLIQHLSQFTRDQLRSPARRR
jgi:hypothetical protein